MSWKEDFIKRYGEGAYERKLEQMRQWKEANPNKAEELNHDVGRKGGKYYEKKLKYQHTGLQGERNKVRKLHGRRWRKYKNIIAPDSQLHHQWLPDKSEYSGLALVEADLHMHGIIDVIRILDGEITVFTEKELRERGEM